MKCARRLLKPGSPLLAFRGSCPTPSAPSPTATGALATADLAHKAFGGISDGRKTDRHTSPVWHRIQLSFFTMLNTKLRKSACLISALGLLGGCSTTPQTTATPTPAHAAAVAAVSSVGWTDDFRLMTQMAFAMDKVWEQNKQVPPSVLREQLNRTQADVKLPAPLPLAVLSPAEIWKRRHGNVVMIANAIPTPEAQRKPGHPKLMLSVASAVMLTADGVGVTNYHVLDNPKSEICGVMTMDGRFFPIVEVLAAQRVDDICVFRVEGSGFAPVGLAVDYPVGMPVTAITHPSRNLFTLTAGVVSRYYFGANNPKDARRPRMGVTADYAKGSSGGPIFAANGDLAGIVSSTSSIYYGRTKEIDTSLQMVLHHCAPAISIRQLCTPGLPPLPAPAGSSAAPEEE